MSTFNKKYAVLLGAVSTAALFSSTAFAEDNWPTIADQRGINVLDRERPEFDAVGVRAGSFKVLPSIATGIAFDDNVFGTENNTEGDLYYTVRPNLTVESDFGRHALNFNAYTASRFYSSDTSEDRFDWGVAADGRLDVSEFTAIQGAISYDQLTEDRTSTNRIAGGAEPTEYDLLSAQVYLNQRFNRMTGQLGVKFDQYDYDDTPRVGGGVIDQDFRDHDRLAVPARLSYDVSADTSIFVRGEYNTREYDQKPPVVAVNRDSDGYDVGVGAAFDITNLIRGEAWVGYMSQDYEQVGFQDIDGVDFGLSGEWYASDLTTVTAGIDRAIEESTSGGSSGHLDTRYSVGIAHELQRNIILSADASYTDIAFEGISRDDETIAAGAGVHYLLNRNMDISLDYDYVTQDSSVVGQDYDKSVVGLVLNLKL